MVTLARRLRAIDVATAAYSSSPVCQALKSAGVDDLFDVCIDGSAAEGPDMAPNRTRPSWSGRAPLEATRRLGVRPDRSVVVEDADVGVTAGRDGGFALVIGVDRTGHADDCCSAVPTSWSPTSPMSRFARVTSAISELPNALESYGQLVGITGRPRAGAVFSTTTERLSPIVSGSRRGHAGRRSGRGAGTPWRRCPRRHPERPRPCRYPQPGRHTRDLVRRQPRVRADRTRRQLSPERGGRRGRTGPRATPPPNCATAWRRFRECGWSTSASPLRFTTARSHRSTSVRSSRQRIDSGSEMAYG